LYAIARIQTNVKPGDTLFEESRDKYEELKERFTKAVSGAYNRLFFPGDSDKPLMATIDNGLSFGSGDHSAETQIEKLLASSRCDNKLAQDYLDELPNYWAMAETYLWPSGSRKVPWRDLQMRARTDPSWPWMPGARGLESLKDEALRQSHWRQTPEGQIEKKPFPLEKTSVNITPQGTDRETGETILTLTPRNAGESPRVYVFAGDTVSERDTQVDDLENFKTSAATLYFIAVDSDGHYETGAPSRWTADLAIRHEVNTAVDARNVELRCVPAADLRYTLDGSNPKNGTPYVAPFAVPASGATVLVAAKAGEVEKTAGFTIPASGDDRVIIDDSRPATLTDGKRVSIDTTDKAFTFIQKFKGRSDTRLKRVQIILGDGEQAVQIRFNDRELDADTIEAAIHGMRAAIGDEQADVQIIIQGGCSFGDGYALKEFADIVGIKLAAGDIEQEAR
jgi:hypothetical protein